MWKLFSTIRKSFLNIYSSSYRSTCLDSVLRFGIISTTDLSSLIPLHALRYAQCTPYVPFHRQQLYVPCTQAAPVRPVTQAANVRPVTQAATLRPLTKTATVRPVTQGSTLRPVTSTVRPVTATVLLQSFTLPNKFTSKFLRKCNI